MRATIGGMVVLVLMTNLAAAAGERPYEMAGRQEPRPPLVDFEDLSGWRAVGHEGAQGHLESSQQKLLWGNYVGALTYSGTGTESWLELLPPEPLVVAEPFDSADIWIWGDNWGWVPGALARVEVAARFEDAEGEVFEADFGVVDYEYWFLAHDRLVPWTQRIEKEHRFPARFTGLIVRGCSNAQPSTIYLDSMSVYREELPPLPKPEVGGPLGFPTRAETILPSNHGPYVNRVEATDGGWRLAYEGEDCKVTYYYRPKDGDLSDVWASVNDGPEFQPLAGGGPVYDFEEQARAQRTYIGGRSDAERVVAGWRVIGEGQNWDEWSVELRIWQKSLVLNLRERRGHVKQVLFGKVRGAPNARLISVPYLTLNDKGPYVVCTDQWFLSGLMDWYVSDASELFGGGGVYENGECSFNGGANYIPLTDGRRNPMRERVFLTISPRFDEVLPNIPNPRSDRIEEAKQALWRNIGFMDLPMLQRYKAYGIDGFMVNHHEVIWRDAGESFTQRLESAPKNVGDERLKEYSAAVKALGYRFGLYTNYCDFAPVNKNWDPDKVVRLSDGWWVRAWPRTYLYKPCYAAEAEAYFAPAIHEQFGTNAGYCDVHTARTPWSATDYDARTPGAGKFRTVFENYGRLLLNESVAHDGPVFSEGRMHWMYAGLVDGNYAQIVSDAPFREPPLVDFDLLKIHPLETDHGMGSPDMFYTGSPDWTEPRDFHSPWFDRFIASTIAYGHIGYLAAEWGLPGTLKSYFLVKALQGLYAGVEVAEIGYEREGQMLDTSEAVRSGAYRGGRVYVRYANGLRVWVNLGWEGTWEVKWRGESYVLPPTGWLAVMEGRLLAYSAVREGGRVEYVESAEYCYLDARENRYRAPALAAKGAVVIKRGEEKGWWLIPATEAEGVMIFPARFAPEWLDQEMGAEAYDEQGRLLGPADTQRTNDGIAVAPVAGAIKYLLQPREALGTLRVEAEGEGAEAVPGQPVAVRAVFRNGGLAPLSDLMVRARWKERPGPWQRAAARLEAGGMVRREFRLAVPPDLSVDEKAWLVVEGRATGEAAVLRCQVAVELALRPVLEIEAAELADAHYAAGQPATAVFRVRYRGGEPAEARVRWHVGGEAEVWQRRVLGPNESAEMGFPVTMPEVGMARSLELFVTVAGYAVTWQGWLTAQAEASVVYDFVVHAGEVVIGSELRTGQVVMGDNGTGGTFQARTVTCGGKEMRGIFAHPPWIGGVGAQFGRFQLDLPPEPAVLRFAIGLSDGSSSRDGVVFKVLVDVGEGPQVVYARQWNERSWAEESVSLERFAGKRVKVTFVTDVGPAHDSNSDWACWGAPRVELAEARTRLALTRELPAQALVSPEEAQRPLTAEDLERAVAGVLSLESAGVNREAPYTSYVYLNGILVGSTPGPGSDTEWSAEGMPLPHEALVSLRPRSEIEIRNPGRDCFKVRRVRLRLTLDTGETVSSYVALGPFSSDKGWLYAEGAGVALGEWLRIAVALPLEGGTAQ